MKKYLIFDLDGTLIQSAKSLTKLVTNYLVENFGKDKDTVSYFLSTTRGEGLSTQVKTILNIGQEEADSIANKIYEKINISVQKGEFFPGVTEKIKELSKNYTLFLSTGNSTTFAEENLKKGGIYQCFKYILGSENIQKGVEHISIFKDFLKDKDFEKYSVFIGDGEKDRDIAKTCSIDFIHIDENLENTFSDKYEIKSVVDIDTILKLIN
ncbi:HAD family hydrolase [Candidatus Gracilibacteria bacterium]|nr:HAD family hydrolase [Candidatus Gracilibacteria bacterium]